MRLKPSLTTLVLLLSIYACSPRGNQGDGTTSVNDTFPVPVEVPEETPKLLTASDIDLKQELIYDEHTLEDIYPYKDTTRMFKWDRIRAQLALIENMQEDPDDTWVVFQNYRNGNGEAPTVEDLVRNEYGRVSDRNGVERYQGVPLYAPGDTTVVVAYARDGWLGHLVDSVGGHYRVRPIWGDERYTTPKRYTEKLPQGSLFAHVAMVDRQDQNICTLEKSERGKWIIRSKNPATTGLHRPPHKQPTPLGIYLLQEKKEKMYYFKDGTTSIGGFAPYASRFCSGAYIHGIPLNGGRTKHIEYSPSLGTTPRSHMCVRNATSHAKFIYDTFPTMSSLVVVIE